MEQWEREHEVVTRVFTEMFDDLHDGRAITLLTKLVFFVFVVIALILR